MVASSSASACARRAETSSRSVCAFAWSFSAAAQVLSASVWAATYNVEINAAALKDHAKAQTLRDEVSALRAHAEALLDATNVAFGARLG